MGGFIVEHNLKWEEDTGSLIPFVDLVPEKPHKDLAIAEAYWEAGMERKAKGLYRALCVNAVIDICKSREIEILRVRFDHTPREWGRFAIDFVDKKGKWNLRQIIDSYADVPLNILDNMKTIPEVHRERLYIASLATRPDPLLLYLLPFFYPQTKLIELAQWD